MCPDVQLYRYIDVQMSRCTDLQIYRCTDLQMYRCTEQKTRLERRWQEVTGRIMPATLLQPHLFPQPRTSAVLFQPIFYKSTSNVCVNLMKVNLYIFSFLKPIFWKAICQICRLNLNIVTKCTLCLYIVQDC